MTTHNAHHDEEAGHFHAPQPLSHNTKPIKLLALTALIFYEVSGGPFGLEDAVSASSPLYALLGFLVFPFLWSVPEALVTAELATTFPENSGYVTWVAAAFGPFAGWMEGWLKWVSGVTDNTVYPLLFIAYLESLVPALKEGLPRLAFLLSFTAVFTYLNWRGLAVVGNTAIGMAVFTLLPFLAMLFIALPRIEAKNLIRTSSKPTDWSAFLNVLFWNLNYFDSVATLAGEVSDPVRTFPRGLFLAVVLVIVSYLMPLVVGLGIGTDPALWREGYLATVAQLVGGKGLAVWVLTAAAISNIGQYLAEMSSDSFQVSGMAERGFLPAFLARRSRYGTPTAGVLLSALGIVAMLCLDLIKIIELLNAIYCLGELLEFAAFIKLRISAPHLHRPFRVPAPTWLCALGLAPASVLLLFLLALPVYTRNTLVLSYCGVTLLIGVVMYHWMSWLRQTGKAAFLGEPPSAQDLIRATELRTPLMRPYADPHGNGEAEDLAAFSLGPSGLMAAPTGPPDPGFTLLTASVQVCDSSTEGATQTTPSLPTRHAHRPGLFGSDMGVQSKSSGGYSIPFVAAPSSASPSGGFGSGISDSGTSSLPQNEVRTSLLPKKGSTAYSNGHGGKGQGNGTAAGGSKGKGKQAKPPKR